MSSVSVLWTSSDTGKKSTAAFLPLIDQRAASLLNEVKAAYLLQGAQQRVTPTEPTMTSEGREAANVVVEQAAGAGNSVVADSAAPVDSAVVALQDRTFFKRRAPNSTSCSDSTTSSSRSSRRCCRQTSWLFYGHAKEGTLKPVPKTGR